jgi:hypothetical protein
VYCCGRPLDQLVTRNGVQDAVQHLAQLRVDGQLLLLRRKEAIQQQLQHLVCLLLCLRPLQMVYQVPCQALLDPDTLLQRELVKVRVVQGVG